MKKAKLLSFVISLVLIFSALSAGAYAAGWTEISVGTTKNFRAVWGSSGNNVFAVADKGTVYHFNGVRWTSMFVGTTRDMYYGVWGSSGDNVFVVGDKGKVMHFDGFNWSAIQVGKSVKLYAIWGSSHDSVYAVGDKGTILHYNGTEWTSVNIEGAGTKDKYYGVWGSSADDVFVVGDKGTVLHFDGTAWTAMSVGKSAKLCAVWGTASDNVFVVGDRGTVLHFDGTAWTAVSAGGTGTRDVYYSICGTSGHNVFIAGEKGTVLHFDGTAWTRISVGKSAKLYGIWGIAGDVFAVGEKGAVLHYKEAEGPITGPVTAWMSMQSLTVKKLCAVWAASNNGVFAVSDGGEILFYDGIAWTVMSSGTTVNICGIWGSSSDNVFAIGDSGTVLHYDGTAWTTMSSGVSVNLLGIWGSSSDNVFAIGDSGTVLHYDGTAWTTMSSGVSVNLLSIWGDSSDNLFAVGDNGTVLHYDGAAWTAMSTEVTVSLRSVWGTSPDNLFAVGDSGTILHYDGTAWTAISAETTVNFHSIWGTSDNSIFAVGESGTILRYDGANWTAMSAGTSENLCGISGSLGDVFAVGANGTILHFYEASWTCEAVFTNMATDDEPLTVNFDSAGSVGSTYEWDYGDGSEKGEGITSSHEYEFAGTYNVTLKVTDENGCEAVTTKTIDITCKNPPGDADGSGNVDIFDALIIAEFSAGMKVRADLRGFAAADVDRNGKIDIFDAVRIAKFNVGITLHLDIGLDLDDDNDGYTESGGDCDDTNPDIHPGAKEICGDGVDQDCNGEDIVCIDEGTMKTGVFLYNTNVAGIEYKTLTHNGVTNSMGEFKYLEGQTVTFSVGSIFLGTCLAKAIVTPIDLVPGAADETDPVVTNICRFLVTLDDDDDVDNGILIIKSVRTYATDISVSFNVSIAAFETNTPDIISSLTTLTSAGQRILIATAAAQEFLNVTLVNSVTIVKNIVTVVQNNVAAITWEPVSVASSYKIYVGYTPDVGPGNYENVYESTTNFYEISLNMGEILFFAVTCVHAQGEGIVLYVKPVFISQGTVSGTVTDAEDNTPICNATVRLDIPGSSIEVLTDSYGEYSIDVPSLGDYCLITVGKQGYIPKTANIEKQLLAQAGTLIADFKLARAAQAVIVLENVPEVYHLGDDEYGGSVNSQFQKLSDGITFTGKFIISADQYNCIITDNDSDGDAPGARSASGSLKSAEFRLVAKGAQDHNEVRVNDNLLDTFVIDSPEDGSFGPLVLPVDVSYLQEGENTLTITSVDEGRTHDDFELANMLMYLYCDEDGGDVDDDEDGYTESEGDCDDTDPGVYPGADEICGDGIDQDCDGSDLICLWTDMSVQTTKNFRAVWGSSPDVVFAVADKGTIFQYNGTEWTEMVIGTTADMFYGIWGSSADNLFVVGDKGTVFHYNGIEWTRMPVGKSVKLFAIWGSSDDNIFAVGDRGTILHYDGSVWTSLSVPGGTGTRDKYYGVWGSSADDVYIVGDKGTVLHFDGTAWTSISVGKSAKFYTVWGSSGDNVFIAGDKGTVMHYDGVEWIALSVPKMGTRDYCYGIWGSSGEDLFVVGDKGRIMYYDGVNWIKLSVGKTAHLYGLWGISGTMFAVGEKGTIFYHTDNPGLLRAKESDEMH